MTLTWLRRPGAVLFVLAVLIGLFLRVLPAGAKRPAANLILKTAYAPFFAIRTWSADLVLLRTQNARLRQALAEASWRWQQHEQHAREVERLRVLLEFTEHSDPLVHVAQIVGWQRRGGREEVIVDLGRTGGLSIYAPAITADGVVGKAVEVMDSFARVQLLTDPACRIAVRDARSGVIGVVRTDKDGALLMQHVAVEADVAVGDSVITAGIGGIFPAGLFVGTVRAVERIPASLLLRIQVTPAARFDRLDYLFFLQREDPLPPGAPYELSETGP